MEIWSKLFMGLCINSNSNTWYRFDFARLRDKTNFIPFAQLSHPEQLNKLMDTRAKEGTCQSYFYPTNSCHTQHH
jgi:hypothetical protein